MLASARLTSSPAVRHAAVAAAGVALAFVVSRAWNLEPRYLVVFVAGGCLAAVGLGLIAYIRSLLLYVLAFCLAFASIEKSFLVTTDSTFVTSGIAIGPSDLALIGLYALWFLGICVTRQERVPRLTTLDKWVFAFWAVHILSALNSVSPILTVYEVVRLGKYVLMYFYIAHNLEWPDLKWIVAGLLFTIALQSGIALVQAQTGRLMGVGRTKGAGDLQYEQYTVTNFESVRRAEGTTFDSHALGLFMAMSLTIPAVLALSPVVRREWRLIAAGMLLVGLPALAISFARAGWLAFASAVAVILLCLASWQRWRRIAMVCGFGATLGVAAVLPFAGKIKQRLFEAPPELISARRETIEMALEIWRDSPWTGIGANGYMVALEKNFSIFEGDPYFIPAHNMVAFVLTEIGIVGLVVFTGFSIAAVLANRRLIRDGDTLVGAFGAALLASLAAFHVEGITDPIYATSVTYNLFWFLLGLTGGLTRLTAQRTNN